MAQVTYLGQVKMYSGDGVFRYTLPAYSMSLNLKNYSSSDINIVFEGIFEANSKSMSELQSIYSLPNISDPQNVTKDNCVHTGRNPAVALYQYRSSSLTTAYSYPQGVVIKDGVFEYEYALWGAMANTDHPALLYNEYYGGWTLCLLYIDTTGKTTGTVGQIYAKTNGGNWVGHSGNYVTQIDFEGADPIPVQINPALLVQSFFVGQAVRRMRGQAAWEVLWEGDMTFTEVQASGKYSASVWSDAEPPAQMFYSGETMRLTVDGETKEYTAKADPYDCAYVGNRWLSLDPIEGEGDTGDDLCVTADTYLISYGFKYTCFARNPGTYHIKIARRKESSPAPVYDQEGA